MKNIKGGYIVIDMKGINISSGTLTETQKNDILSQLDSNVLGNALLLQNLTYEGNPISLWGSYDNIGKVIKTQTSTFDLTTNSVYSTGLNRPIYKHIFRTAMQQDGQNMFVSFALLRNNDTMLDTTSFKQWFLNEYVNDVVNGVITDYPVTGIEKHDGLLNVYYYTPSGQQRLIIGQSLIVNRVYEYSVIRIQ